MECKPILQGNWLNPLDIDAMCTQLEEGLNKPGNDGWELCLEVPGVVVFKRPK